MGQVYTAPYTGGSEGTTLDLTGKKVIALGEREGVPGPAIAAIARAAGAEVVFIDTQCFV